MWRILRITLNALIALFFITSVLGWVLANYVATKGRLGNEVTSLYEHMTLFEHLFRYSQVFLVFSASMALIFAHKLAFPFFAATLVVTLIANSLQGVYSQLNLVVSFMSFPAGIIIVASASAYAFYQQKKGYIK